MKIGEIVQCVRADNSDSLESFCDYKIVAINAYGNIQVRQNFNGHHTLAHFYMPNRFISLNSKSKTEKIVDKKEIDFSKTYVSRDGCKVNLLARSQDKIYPVIGEILQDGKWNSEKWKKDGKFFECNEESDLDLIEEKNFVDCVGFKAHVYKDGSVFFDGLHIFQRISKKEMSEIVKIWQKFN